MAKMRRTTGNGGKEHTSTSPPNSAPSDEQSSDSKKFWPTPTNVGEFASQANKLATMVLNGHVDPEVARTYATLARVVAQAASISVSRSRFLKTEPDLSLEGYGE